MKVPLQKNVPLTLFEKGYSRFYGERELETEQNCNILTPHSYGRQRCVFLVLLGCSTGGPGAQLSAECWLSLPHLISNFSGPQIFWLPTQSGAPRSPSVWCEFPYHNSSITATPTVWLFVLTELYIIVQRPLNCLLHLWSGMFDRHQAEITVMQFTGHSLPVHQSMSVPWEF